MMWEAMPSNDNSQSEVAQNMQYRISIKARDTTHTRAHGKDECGLPGDSHSVLTFRCSGSQVHGQSQQNVKKKFTKNVILLKH